MLFQLLPPMLFLKTFQTTPSLAPVNLTFLTWSFQGAVFFFTLNYTLVNDHIYGI